jgi:hypothetical protein
MKAVINKHNRRMDVTAGTLHIYRDVLLSVKSGNPTTDRLRPYRVSS